MSAPDSLFLVFLCVNVYVYVGYPAIIYFSAKMKPGNSAELETPAVSVSVILALYNEEERVEDRLTNLLECRYPTDEYEIVVVSDGSTDGTAERVRLMAKQEERIKLLDREVNQGKAAALNLAVSNACNELLVFADARQSFARDAVVNLCKPFSDPSVGVVTGELVVRSDTGSPVSSLYWEYEKWIRSVESFLFSLCGATGAIYAIRKADYAEIPSGCLLDDMFVPLRTVLDGKRIVLERNAVAFDIQSRTLNEEYQRKVRTIAGNYQLISLEPWLLSPQKNPIWFQWVSHKLGRLVAPFSLLGMYLLTPFLENQALFLMGVIALVFFLLFLGGIAAIRLQHEFRLLSPVTNFFLLNCAACEAGIRYLTNSFQGIWVKH